MYINTTGYYIPKQRIPNSYYTEKTGLTDDWIVQRTGIHTRSRAAAEVDLLIAATYSPYDTVGTAAHVAQHHYAIPHAKAFTLSSACSSFINALEVVEGYFAMGKAHRALIIGGDKNTAYSNEDDPKSGHLWGDAAVAFFLSNERIADTDAEVLEVYTEALGTIGKGPESIQLRPRDGGIRMPEGKDVFLQACTYMPQNALRLLTHHGYTFDDLSYFIGHQANMRILKNIATSNSIPEEKILSNIAELGNTGSASSALVYAQNRERFQAGDLVCLSVFGGGYSAGATLIKV